jgi:hypothetical protein
MRSRSALAAALLLAVGCGRGLATPAYDQPFGTIHGTLSIPPAMATGNLRIALVWLGFGNGAGQVEQAVSVSTDSLTTFRIDVSALPPPSTLWGTPDRAYAQGAIVAYDDADGDGRLDIEPPGVASRDRVLGRSYDTRIFFLGSGPPAPVSTGFEPAARGLSLVHFQQRAPAPGSCAHEENGAIVEDPCMFELVDPSPIALPGDIVVELRDDPHLGGYACQYFWGSEDWPDWFGQWNQTSPLEATLCRGAGCDCVGSNCALDLPTPGAAVTCAADGTSYTYVTCVDDPDLCGTRFCHYGHGERRAQDPPAANWPCP